MRRLGVPSRTDVRATDQAEKAIAMMARSFPMAMADPGQARRTAGYAGKTIAALAAAALLACGAASHAQAPPAAPEQSAPAAATAPAPGLSDLDAMTFDCAKAGLNAAAREAAKAPTQGSYQFAYFKIVGESHHAAYEVDFKSNYAGEPDLNYCVAIYCQQGWDPKTAQVSVQPMARLRSPVRAGSQGTGCAGMQSPTGK
jgi:hypothetical protein